MGRNKLSLRVGGVSIVCRVHDVLSATCDEVLVSAPGAIPEIEARHVPDERPGGIGPLAGMEAGLTAARNPLVFVAAGDMPFLSADMVEYLLGRVSTEGIQATVPLYDGMPQPLCAAYDRSILPEVTRTLDLGVLAVRELFHGLKRVEYVEDELRRFGDPELLLMNVNTPEDLDRARDALRFSER